MNTPLLVVTANSTFSIFVGYECSEKLIKFTQESRESSDYFRFADYPLSLADHNMRTNFTWEKT